MLLSCWFVCAGLQNCASKPAQHINHPPCCATGPTAGAGAGAGSRTAAAPCPVTTAVLGTTAGGPPEVDVSADAAVTVVATVGADVGAPLPTTPMLTDTRTSPLELLRLAGDTWSVTGASAAGKERLAALTAASAAARASAAATDASLPAASSSGFVAGAVVGSSVLMGASTCTQQNSTGIACLLCLHSTLHCSVWSCCGFGKQLKAAVCQ